MTHETNPNEFLFTSHDLDSLPLEVQQAYHAAINRPVIAEIHVKLFSLEPGQSEVGVRIDPNGALKDGLGSGQARAAAYHQLLATLERELRQALDLLAQAR